MRLPFPLAAPRPRLATAVVLGVCALTLCRAQEPAPPAGRGARWREDLKLFADEFPRRHVDFAKLYPRSAFDQELARLHADVPKLSDAEITLRLMRLVASAGIAHTYVRLPVSKLGFQQLPVSLRWYSDGLAVMAATPEHAQVLGTRVLRIGLMTPEQLLAVVAPYISHENEGWLREQSTGYLATINVLQQVGAAGADGRVTFTLSRPGRQPFTHTVTPGDPRVKQVPAFDALNVPVALYRKQPTSYYWYECLPDARALYIQYNRCQIDPKLPFKDFARDLFAFAYSHPVQRVVVDLRFNSGGNSIVMYPLWAGLKSRPGLASHVYVLIGAGTFSSAVDNAMDLRRELGSILVGEPTGGNVNSYGEVREFTLPNSGLVVQYCTRLVKLTENGNSTALEPDILVPRTLDDALAGRDPVLEAALRHSPSSK